MPTSDDLLEGLLHYGSYMRYGMSPTEKYRELVTSPEYSGARRESDRTEAERAQSTRRFARMAKFMPAGEVPATLLPIGANLIREGGQGLGAIMHGKPFFTPGGFESNDPTVSDEGADTGFNLRSFATAFNNTPAGELLAALKGR